MSFEDKNTSTLTPSGQAPSLSLNRKKSVRGGYRVHSTKLSTEARTLLDSEEPPKVRLEYLVVSLKDKLVEIGT